MRPRPPVVDETENFRSLVQSHVETHTSEPSKTDESPVVRKQREASAAWMREAYTIVSGLKRSLTLETSHFDSLCIFELDKTTIFRYHFKNKTSCDEPFRLTVWNTWRRGSKQCFCKMATHIFVDRRAAWRDWFSSETHDKTVSWSSPGTWARRATYVMFT